MSICVLSLWLLAADPSSSSQPAVDPADRAELAHAEGLLEETDGRFQNARDLLLKALELQPQNVDFAFDLARVSWEHRLSSRNDDAKAFLAMPAKTPEQALLRSYLLADRKDTAAAKSEAQRALELDPNNMEAQLLGQTLDKPAGTPPPKRPWTVRARVGVEYDSNVTLIQDATPSDEGGPRLMLSAGGAWQPTMDNVRLSLGIDISGGIHLANRTKLDQAGNTALNLALFDFAQIVPRFSADARLGDNRLIGSLYMSQVFLEGFLQHFLQDFGAVLEYRRVVAEVWQPGIYAGVGYRDYTTGPFNQPGDTDRDGLHLNAGAGLFFVRSDVAAHVRAGFQFENAAGREQRELGPEADAAVRFNVYRFSFGATLAYMGRFYGNSTTGRADQRVSAGFVASIACTDWFFVDLDYRFVRNVSPATSPFDYMRHLTALTLRAAF